MSTVGTEARSTPGMERPGIAATFPLADAPELCELESGIAATFPLADAPELCELDSEPEVLTAGGGLELTGPA